MPEAFWVSRICEEFHCLPSQAFCEVRRVPAGWLDEILEARHFASAYHLWTTARRKSDVPKSEMVDLVKQIEFGLVQDELDARQADDRR